MEMNGVCNIEVCTGCGACLAICPVGCISMKEDEEGFRYPFIEKTKCINCKKCIAACPSLNNIKKRRPQLALGGISIDGSIFDNAASGGAFGQLSKKVLEGGGVVYGCKFDANFQAEISRVSDLRDLSSIQGSKYVASDSLNSFKQVESDLRQGIRVLYGALPCQVAGLLSYLGGSKEGLTTVDLICHGTPSGLFFREYLRYKELTAGKVISIKFRNKYGRHRKSYCGLLAIKTKGSVKASEIDWLIDSYYGAFMRKLNYRPSCYRCPYASQSRVSDLTLGDCWGLHFKNAAIETAEGSSLIICNTDKGKHLVQEIDSLTVETVSYRDAVNNNEQLNNPSSRPAERDIVYKLLNSQGYGAFEKWYQNTYFSSYVMGKIKMRLRHIEDMIRC